MSSIAQTQPRTGRRNFTLRAYLAGTAATAALLGAVVLVFASLGAYVAFNGLPIGGDQAASAPSSVEVGAAAQPAKANAAVRHQQITTAAVHRQSASGNSSASHSSGGSSSNGGSTASGQVTPSPASPAAPTGTSTATVEANGAGNTVSAGPGQASPSGGGGSLPTPNVTTPDSVGSTVGTVEQTLHQAGVDVPVGQAGSAVDQVTDGLAGGN